MNIEVISVPDLPVLTLGEANKIDELAASITWSVFDNDGPPNHELRIELDGILLQDLDDICVTTDNLQECTAIFEVPQNRSVTVQVKVSIFDSEFTSAVVEYTIIDFNSTVTVIEDTVDEVEVSEAVQEFSAHLADPETEEEEVETEEEATEEVLIAEKEEVKNEEEFDWF